MSYIGLDIGTTRCKAVAFDEEGRTIATAYRDYPLEYPEPGAAELDSREVCDKAMAVLAECAAACASDPPRAMGISSQGEAVTPVDAAGVPLANAMVSSDARPARIAREWTADFRRGAALSHHRAYGASVVHAVQTVVVSRAAA